MRLYHLLAAFLLLLVFGATVFASEIAHSSARFRPDERGVDVFAGLIVWTAREPGADCWAEVIHSRGLNSSNDLREVRFGWDLGFRVGAGYHLKYDQWDTQLYYTHFDTLGKDRVDEERGTVHSTFLGNFYVDNPIGLGLSGPAYESASINWKIQYHMFDWELGRSFWLSPALAIRPFIGGKGGWIDQSIHTKWKNTYILDLFLLFREGIENVNNDFWGVGPVAGIHTKWILFSPQNNLLSLIGDCSAALMYGHWSFSDKYQNDMHQKVIIGSQNFKSCATMIRILFGVEWNHDFYEKRYRIGAKLGYETQVWLNQLQFYSFVGGRMNSALTLQGGTFEFHFDF
ncbi:MAG: hypothetical protein KDK71_04910 [Chlamydiia bacterium]|nr:hypothetical protein [Chlamydiia bacterium]